MRLLAVAALCALSASTSRVTPPPEPSSPLPPHPRLILTPARQAALRTARAANGTDIALFFSQLEAHAAYALTAPPVPHGVPGPSGILIQVRSSLDLLLTTAAAHLFRTDAADGRFLERAVRELLNLCSVWPDWNTVQHALDTGEALLATGLAYDWLYADLNATVRAAALAGIVSRGLAPYRAYVPNRTVFWWVNNTINWNCVCSSGGVAAVLATYGDAGAPAWAWGDVLQPLVGGVAPCVAAYNVDSSWEEGPAYWAYASKYNVWLFSSLATALGDASAAGLLATPGVPAAARFPMWSTGARGLFNWADSSALGEDWTPFSQWWGTAFNDSAAAYWSRLGSAALAPPLINTQGAWGGFVEALAFYEPRGGAADLAALPTSKLYDFINVAVFRSRWDAPASASNYVGLKGGNSAWNHGHLDLGSFVMDYQGGRLAEDLGADSYNLPGYFDNSMRWKYYRLNSLGHSVLIFDGASQTHPAAAAITAFNATGAPPGLLTVDGFAVVDLSAAYAGAGVARARRGFVSLAGAGALIIVDELAYSAGARPANVTWRLHTRAAAAQLSPLQVSLGGPAHAQLAVLPDATSCMGAWGGWSFTNLTTVLPDPPYDSAAGLTRVEAAFVAPAPGCNALAFALGDAEAVSQLVLGTPAVRPIDDWATLGPLQAAA